MTYMHKTELYYENIFVHEHIVQSLYMLKTDNNLLHTVFLALLDTPKIYCKSRLQTRSDIFHLSVMRTEMCVREHIVQPLYMGYVDNNL